MNESAPKEVVRGYAVRREIWQLGGRPIQLVWPEDMDALLDSRQTQERFARNEYMPYWAQPWPAGILLAEHILAGEPGQGRHAVEIGCGVGLVSVAAAMMGWRVTASDYDDDALAFARLNAELNGVRLEATEWIDFVEQAPPRRYDCVFAADLLYERRLSEPVARWIAAALEPGGYALASDPNRSAASSFPEFLAGYGLNGEMQEVQTTAPAGLLTRGRIWRITLMAKP
ncbi:MAG TPA: methyltransferase domain-containing protein [Phycisphaerae bacterium]|nr:methyltransferase domain-containing protein [Phycisphaerae bacterium]HPP28457.1 methyltransferase domain-containing protein [Phycisphaerae bacterium]HPU25883.1 methyltransferase domain-containing protein [Phycisphaerae bacterium]HPZ97991.1 methyltransferase domain-containing protein [Phycisphaerae bacterium]HQE26328.1 methyltransferase domain-containing protein [Phycisphaerae bacterium]